MIVRLKPGREGPVRAGHPWVFSGAIACTEGEGPQDTGASRQCQWHADRDWLCESALFHHCSSTDLAG